ncbi:hypothetical protein ABZP36_027771 [Zizania latifolia]
MCFELADQRGPRGGGGGRPAKAGGDDYHGGRAAEAAAPMTVAGQAGASELMSGYYQEQEMSTMVSALARVLAGGDPWAAAAAEAPVPAWAAHGGGAHERSWEEQAMHGGYVHEQGSYLGAAAAPSPEFAALMTYHV